MMRPALLLMSGFLALAASEPALAQAYVVGWGPHGFDSRSGEGTYTHVEASGYMTIQLRSDGAVFVNGYWAEQPPSLPPGVTFVHCAVGGYALCCGVRSDGLIEQWAKVPLQVPSGQPHPVPTLPMGMSYVQAAVTLWTAGAIRSDGQVIIWGRDSYDPVYSPPSPPPGTTFVKLKAGTAHYVALAANGSVSAWGLAPPAYFQPPALPTGVTYTDIAAGDIHTLLLRSDGLIETLGDNSEGQRNVPPLPPGLTYTDIECGEFHSLARRSDGTWIGWGRNGDGQCNVPTPPPGQQIVAAEAGAYHSIGILTNGELIGWGSGAGFALPPPAAPQGTSYRSASGNTGHGVMLLDDGNVMAWGAPPFQLNQVPALPSGMTYIEAVAGYAHNLALRSDGQIVGWGDNSLGQSVAPPLPPGVTYTKIDPDYSHSVALRSDGMAIDFGSTSVVTTPPPPPPGVSYVEVDAANRLNLMVRSDGLVTASGGNGLVDSRLNVPAPPGDTAFRKATAGDFHCLGLLTDGTLVPWGLPAGGGPNGPTSPPPLPPGVAYVDIASSSFSNLARRSDGSAVHWGNWQWYQDRIPTIGPGESFFAIHCGIHQSTALVGSRSSYVTIAAGCAGSRPSSRLIPEDTPRIGSTLRVRLFDLPVDTAFVAMGWDQPPQPIALTGVGMPGCVARINLHAIRLLTGNGGQAVWELGIPYNQNLIGLEFYNQAFVLDPSANALGAVVSDTAHAVIGG